MKTRRTSRVVTVGVGAVSLGLAALATAQTDGSAESSNEVEIVSTVGCVERRDATSWWLVRGADPTVGEAGVFRSPEVEEAKLTPLGEHAFELVGVAEFLDAESLLAWGERSTFTTPDQANATGELRDGHTVLVKGLLIEGQESEAARLNLLSVVGWGETCPVD